MKIFIDPGHGGKDPGAVGGDMQEKDIALEISKRLKFDLETLGHEVRMSRERDEAVDLNKRCDMANVWSADIFVSVHCNASEIESVSGFEVIYWPGSVAGKELASDVCQNLAEFCQMGMGMKNRGYKTDKDIGRHPLFVLRKTQMPAIIVECGFITNQHDRLFGYGLMGLSKFAIAIAEGIRDYSRGM